MFVPGAEAGGFGRDLDGEGGAAARSFCAFDACTNCAAEAGGEDGGASCWVGSGGVESDYGAVWMMA